MLNRRMFIVSLTLGAVFLLGSSATEARAAVEKSLDRGVEVIAQEIVETLPQDKKPLLAVLDFSDLSDCVSAFGRLTSEELVTKLFKTKRARVVERGLLKKALNELKFNLSELVDPTRAKQLGKQVGADAIVSGTITDLGSSVKINARVIEVERGDVLAAAGVELAKDESVKQLVSQTLSCPGKGPGPPPPLPPPSAKELPKFEDKGIRVTVKSFRKEGNSLKAELIYRNVGEVGSADLPLCLAWKGNRYAADDAGEQWALRGDSAFTREAAGNPCDTNGHIMFPPQVNIRVPMTFSTSGDTAGRVFNIVLDHTCWEATGRGIQICQSAAGGWNAPVRVLIRNITAE